MKDKIPFYRSFRFRFVFLVVATQLVFVAVAGIYSIRKQSAAEMQKAFLANTGNLKVASSFVRNALTVFGENLNLLAVTPAIGSFDPVESGKMLKTYKVSSLFISGERVALYDNNNHFIADNWMVGGSRDTVGFKEFWSVEPLHVYMGKTSWQQFSPMRTFAVTVQNYARANGVLTANFSFRRLSSFLTEFRVGEKGYVILVDSDGRVLYHPETKWTKVSVPITQLGFPAFDPKQYKIDTPTHMTLTDGKEYMVNYLYDPSAKLGFISLQPRQELEAMVSLVRRSMIALLVSLLVVMTLLASWVSTLLAKPLHILTEKMQLVRDGNLDVSSGIDRQDEIGLLADVFDTMRLSIRQYIRELGAHRDRLEAEVAQRTAELQKTNRILQMMSRTDDLTGIPNRRDIMEKIRYEMYRSQRSQRPFAFIIGDIDKFKSFNDTYGHDCGDGVLRSVAQAMRAMLRRHDYIARWGGEEFLVVLPETDHEGSLIVAERIRKKVETTENTFAGKRLRVTITLGVALFDGRLGVERSISLADKALYRGKEQGRNRVEFWDAADTPTAEFEAAAREFELRGGSDADLPIDVLERLDEERRKAEEIATENEAAYRRGEIEGKSGQGSKDA